MINITDKSQCCGCNACSDICPKNAISYKVDNEGFWYPIVDTEKCINCGLCEKCCPIIQSENFQNKDLESPICYAAQCKNLESLFNSTSGSAFATLAEKMYKLGGYVGGAIFNDDYTVSQFISNNKEDLDILRNSKYSQSNSEGFYIAVRDLLNKGEKVLVCGLPCQMAGLQSFLKKDYENLITIDLICLGINSPKILPAYIKYLEDKYQSKIVYYKAKNKELGWRQLTTKVVFENGKVLYDKKNSNYFTHGFVATHSFARPSCYQCKFKGKTRATDMTIGDLWGVEKLVGREYDNDLGTSVIIVNSANGEHFLNLVKSSFKLTEVKYSDVVKGNPALVTSITKSIYDREELYNDFNSMKFEDFAKKYIKVPDLLPLRWKSKVKNILRFIYHTFRASRFNVVTIYRNLYYNLFCSKVQTDIINGKFIIINNHSILQLEKNSQFKVDGMVEIGVKRFSKSKLETRVLVEQDACLHIGGGSIYYGADIEIFKGAKLTIGTCVAMNINTCIICSDEIVIGDNVSFGRNVTIRDNNGGHFMSRRIYKDKRPVSIGQHVWICEQAIIMPGSKIGTGAIIGARSLVSGKIPNFTLASGSPATIVDENIFWKQ